MTLSVYLSVVCQSVCMPLSQVLDFHSLVDAWFSRLVFFGGLLGWLRRSSLEFVFVFLSAHSFRT